MANQMLDTYILLLLIALIMVFIPPTHSEHLY